MNEKEYCKHNWKPYSSENCMMSHLAAAWAALLWLTCVGHWESVSSWPWALHDHMWSQHRTGARDEPWHKHVNNQDGFLLNKITNKWNPCLFQKVSKYFNFNNFFLCWSILKRIRQWWRIKLGHMLNNTPMGIPHVNIKMIWHLLSVYMYVLPQHLCKQI